MLVVDCNGDACVAGLTGLTRSTQLTSLNLALCREISDAGVASVAALPKLQTLDMTFCDRITDASVHHLCRCALTIPPHIAVGSPPTSCAACFNILYTARTLPRSSCHVSITTKAVRQIVYTTLILSSHFLMRLHPI